MWKGTIPFIVDWTHYNISARQFGLICADTGPSAKPMDRGVDSCLKKVPGSDDCMFDLMSGEGEAR